MSLDLKRVIGQVERDRGVDREVLIETIKAALLGAARKKYGPKLELEAHFDEEKGDIEIFQFKTVVDHVNDPDIEISFKEARKTLDSEAELGDDLGVKVDISRFGRIAAQTAKQVIIQKMKEAERDNIFADFKDRKGELVNGTIQRFERGDIIVNLGRTEAVLPKEEQIPRETYHRGDRIRAYIIDVKNITKGPQIFLSRAHPDFITKLFEVEVPEIFEGIIKVVNLVREPGERTKIAVKSEDSDVDPVGACVGMRGSRIQSVLQELKVERIDIIRWNADIVKYVCNALSPAEVTKVIVEEDSRSMEIIVPDDKLSLAIGRRGQNVRLAAKLTGWRIDVRGETTDKKISEESFESLCQIPGIGKVIGEILFEGNYRLPGELAGANIDELTQLPGIGEKRGKMIIKAAQEYLNNSSQQ